MASPSSSGPPSSLADDRGRFTGRVVAAVAVVVVVATIVVVAVRTRSHAPPAAAVRDVPRLEDGAIVFSPGFRDRAGIAFTPIERAQFRPNVRVVGTVAFNPSYVAAIGTRLRGTVRRTFKYEGDKVEANEALAEVESAELGEAQSTIAQAQARADAAEIHARREKDLLDQGLTTAREAELASSELTGHRASLQAAQQRVRALGGNASFGLFVLRTPIAGHVVERHLSPGQSVEGTAIGYKIADVDHLWVELSIYEKDLSFVRLDDDVELNPLAEPKTKIHGKIAHIGEVIAEATRSTAVRVAVDFPKYHLRPGQSVQATITGRAVERDAALVPQAAVVYVDGKATVFVADGDTRVRAVTVRLGASDGTCFELLEGPEPGQRVATNGVFALKSELYR